VDKGTESIERVDAGTAFEHGHLSLTADGHGSRTEWSMAPQL
jgi:hypothetical protein